MLLSEIGGARGSSHALKRARFDFQRPSRESECSTVDAAADTRDEVLVVLDNRSTDNYERRVVKVDECCKNVADPF